LEKVVYEAMRDVQARHWWYSARRRILDQTLERVRDSGVPDGVIYDLGCGVGANLAMLKRFGTCVGVDSSPEAVAYCHELGHHEVLRSDLERLEGLTPDSGNVVLLADVLEHLDDVDGCLRSVRTLLKPGGAVVITVPAFMFLWSGLDELAHHRRRYTERELRQSVGRHFEIEWSTYFNTLLFLPAYACRVLERALGRDGSDESRVPPWPFNDLLRSVFAAETHLLERTRLPFGVSVLCVARKPR
jgi:SAM-dependent methyltransferase